jgi:hypothetical protein
VDLTFGRHARQRLARRGISEEMARAVVEQPQRSEPQRRQLVAHYGVAGGRAICVVVAYDVIPPFVVTVMHDWSGEEAKQ